MKHFDTVMVKVNELYVVKLLQHKMAGIVQYIATAVIAGCLKEALKRHSIVQVFPGMDFITYVDAGLIESVQNRQPPRCQFPEPRFHQP